MGDGSAFFLTRAGDVLGDIGNWFTGPAGDPSRIRQIAGQVDAVNAEYQGSRSAPGRTRQIPSIGLFDLITAIRRTDLHVPVLPRYPSGRSNPAKDPA
ncbi:MAG TPA: hypothetical protein VEK76_00150 [Candidatus Binatia bacterium]|nr:hypothetical protein [Candidatus Binatia bacterium]